MLTALRTARLIVRQVQVDDIDALHERRNDPAVAVLQAWDMPWPRERAESIVAGVAAVDGPVDGVWWMATIEQESTGDVVGDLVVHLSNEGRTGELGYSLARQHWGHGYAVEALGALVGWLFESRPVTRLEGRLHPDNRASAMVLERTGFVFEGHTRLSFWRGDDNSDDWIYAMTRADWDSWCARPTAAPDEIRLIEVSAGNSAAVRALATHHSQEAFVAPVLHSLADALIPEVVDGAPLVPWLRAIEADGELVGFVMLALATAAHPEPYLWRLLVDRRHQRRGIASRVLDLVEAQCAGMGAASLLTSWGEGKGSPRPFYLRHGFTPTGRIVDGETEARRSLG